MNLFKYEDEIISRESIVKALSPYINKGDIVCAEIDVMRFGSLYSSEIKKNDLLEEIFKVFVDLVGEEGHLIVPSFSYSWGSTSPKKVFDVKKTRGKVGIFPEYLRKFQDVARTKDPMFSYLIWGKRKEYFADIGNSSFGKDSVFEKIHKENAKLVAFGLTRYDPTFVHYVEERFNNEIKEIGYRSIVEFEGEYQNGEVLQDEKHYCMMRPMGSNKFFTEKKLIKRLSDNKKMDSINIGAGVATISDCNSVFDECFIGMKDDIHFLVEEK